MSDALIDRLREAATAIALCPQMETRHGETQDLAIAELTALREERDRLRAALRGQVVDRTGDYGRCVLCEKLWRFKDSESHEAGCLAALGERSGERE